MSNQDWRLQGQERYLRGAMLYRRAWTQTAAGSDHDHCEFCSLKFGVGGEVEHGFATADGYRWICAQCFHDFRERFGWQLGQ